MNLRMKKSIDEEARSTCLNRANLCYALLIVATSVVVVYRLHYRVERKSIIDDAIGAVAMHRLPRLFGVFMAGTSTAPTAGPRPAHPVRG